MTSSRISVTHGGSYTPEGLTLYVSADLYGEVIAELDAQGIKGYPIQQFSQTAVAAVIVLVGFLQANGISQIAQLIEAIAHRHDGKTLRVKMGGDEFDASGDTHKRMAAQLEHLQQENAAEQRTLKQIGIKPVADADSDGYSTPNEGSDPTA